MGKGAHMSKAARQSLEELQASILFAPDFPRRVTYTHTEYLELLKARSTEMYAPGLEAIERARDQVNHLQSLIDLFRREHYEPAVPILARLWKDCALQPVWTAVGHHFLLKASRRETSLLAARAQAAASPWRPWCLYVTRATRCRLAPGSHRPGPICASPAPR
jgi:hypothetical protein